MLALGDNLNVTVCNLIRFIDESEVEV